MNLKYTKEQLLAALESRRTWARKLDKKRAAERERDEKKYLGRFQAKLREALNWDYETAKKREFSVGLNGYSERDRRPRCPEGVEQNLDRYISQVAMDGREKYVLSSLASRGGWADATTEIYWLLTHGENQAKDICQV